MAGRQDGPIRSLALCSFRPRTRRRCGGRSFSPRCRGLELLGWLLGLVAMEWGSESAAVRRHRVGGERRDGPSAGAPPGRQAPEQEPLVDACGGGAGTRKRSAAGSRAARTGLSEARAALGLAFYLLALRALVQLSLQQLVLRGAAEDHAEFDARQARYLPFPRGPRYRAPHPCAPVLAGPSGLRRRRPAARGVGRSCAILFRSPDLQGASIACSPVQLVVQTGMAREFASAFHPLSDPPARGCLVVLHLLEHLPPFTSLPAFQMK